MRIINKVIGQDKYHIKCPLHMTPIGFCIHNTANDASAENEVAYMHRNSNQVSFHVAVDNKEVVKALPFDRNSWHAGDGRGVGNTKYISIEICYSKSGGLKFSEAENLAAKYVAMELLKRDWGLDRIKAHRDFSGKDCPYRTDMVSFKKLVATYMGQDVGAGIVSGDKVDIVGLNYATGELIPAWVRNDVHTVKQVKLDKALLQEINSWVYLVDLKKRNVSNRYHMVVKGDTLYSIGKLYNVSIDLIKELNNINGNTIFIGQNLRIK